MMNYLNKLLNYASTPLSANSIELSSCVSALAGTLTSELSEMLSLCNGFYALESALHVFPASSSPSEFGLDEWNGEFLWRKDYEDMANDCLFFAEDIFGGQFCIKNNKIYCFDPENGDLEYLSDSIDDWAGEIINDYNFLTGFPLAHEWQKINGMILSKKRLLPKLPFVAGGKYEIDNLYLADAVTGMKFRASIAKQIKNIPDGSYIRFNINY